MAIEIKAGKLSTGKNIHALIKNVNTNGYVTACDKKISCEPDPSISLEQISCKSCLRLKFVQDEAKVCLPLTVPPEPKKEPEPKPEQLPKTAIKKDSKADKPVEEKPAQAAPPAVEPEQKESAQTEKKRDTMSKIESIISEEEKIDKELFEQVQKLAGAFQLKNEEEIRLVIKTIEDAPLKETPTELRIRIIDTIKNFRSSKSKDPWPNKAEKKIPQKDPGMAVLNSFTPKERNLVLLGKKTIEEIQIARKYKDEKREMRIKLKMKKAQERREIREAKKAIKRLTKKRLKKITPKAKKRNEYGNKLGSWQDFLDKQFEQGGFVKQIIANMQASDLFKKMKPKKMYGRIKGHVRRLNSKGFYVSVAYCPKPKSIPKNERHLQDYYKVIQSEKNEEEKGE